MKLYKILYVTTGSLSTNGSVQRAVHLTRAGRDHGLESKVLLLDTEQNRFMVEQNGISSQVLWVEGRKLKYYLRYKEAIEWCDVLHLITPTLAGLRFALTAGRLGRFVLSDWDELFLIPVNGLLYRMRRVFLHWSNAMITDGYLFASRALQQWYHQGGGRKPNAYIPYGLWPRVSTEAQPAPSDKNGREWVFYFGSYHQVYRDDLREVVNLARVTAGTNIGLMLAGQGMELPGLLAELRGILPPGRLKVLGFVQDVDALLLDPQIKLCFLPIKETLLNRCRCPNKMFHYTMADKMVLTNRVGEVWENLGEQAEYYEFGDLQSMGSAFSAALARVPKYDFPAMTWVHRAGEYRKYLERSGI